MKRGLFGRLLGGSVLLGFVVAAAFAILLTTISDLRESERLAGRAHKVQAAATALELVAIELQTGSRGFVISGDESFLEPWAEAKGKIPAQQAELKRLITDPQQQRRAAEIAKAIDAYLVDYSIPLVETARRDLDGARLTIGSGRGKQLMDGLQQQFEQFAQTERTLSRARDAHADSTAWRAGAFGVGGLIGSVVIVFFFAAYLGNVIVRPVRRLAAAAHRLSEGDLASRVPEDRGAHEIAELARGFNAMAAGFEESQNELESQNIELETQTIELETQATELEEQQAQLMAAHDELESQNIELETQTIELETQATELEENQEQLMAANNELAAQQSELERALAELGEEKERVEVSYAFSERLAQVTDVEALASRILDQVADVISAEIGAAYVAEAEGELAVAAARGIDAARVAAVATGESMAGRALAECRTVTADYGESGLAVAAFGEHVLVRRELHVPLVYGSRSLGVLSFGRLADREFSPPECDAVERLAGQATVALANALALRDVQRLADVNRAVLDATTDAILMADLDGRTMVSNTAMRQIAERAVAVSEVSIWDAAVERSEQVTHPAEYLAAIERLLADPEREAVDVYQVAESGAWLQRYSGPVRNGEGLVVGRIFVIRDITVERQAQQLKSDLVATVSHELRTPLTGILGFAELLALNDVDDDSRNNYVETIRREATRLSDLINDFLDLQRIEEGSFRLQLEPVALAELLGEQASLFDAHSSLHSIELEVDPRLDVLGERDRIAQVIANLLSNAIKYSPEGDVVRVRAWAAGANIRVEVTDTGIGIPTDQQRRIFEKFFRVDSTDTRRIGGTGLGLALSRDIVEAHGGTIGFSSVEGRGTTFWFELPSTETDMSRQLPAARTRMLVVEDIAGTAELLPKWLAEEGDGAEAALTDEEALARIARDRPAA